MPDAGDERIRASPELICIARMPCGYSGLIRAALIGSLWDASSPTLSVILIPLDRHARMI